MASPRPRKTLPYAYSILSNWPAGHFFRIYVDGKLQALYKGKQGYEAKEPNSSHGMLRGIAFILNHLDRVRNRTFLQDLHRVVFTNLTLSGGKDANTVATPGQFRTNHTHIPIGRDNASHEGLLELCAQIARGQVKGCIIDFDIKQHQQAMASWEQAMSYYEDKIKKQVAINEASYRTQATKIFESTQQADPGKVLFAYIPFIPKDIRYIQHEIGTLVDDALDRYIKKLGSSDNIFEIVDHIIDLGIKLERDIHPFVDGNCRTIITLLVNDCLMRMGIPFSCLFDPNRFDFFSKKQLAAEIFRGINITLNAFTEPNRAYYQFNPTSSAPSLRQHTQEESPFMDANTQKITDGHPFNSSALNQLRLMMQARKNADNDQAPFGAWFKKQEETKEAITVTTMKKRHPYCSFFTYKDLQRLAQVNKGIQSSIQPMIGEIEAQAYSILPKQS